MKTIIAGSRSIKQSVVVQRAIKQSNFHITEVFSGNARGVDTLGERWAEDNRIPIKYFPADWKAHQKSAGPIRNQAMANEADALIAVWDGDSRGTADMIHRAEKNGLLVFVYNLKHVAERRAKKCYICKLTAGVKSREIDGVPRYICDGHYISYLRVRNKDHTIETKNTMFRPIASQPKLKHETQMDLFNTPAVEVQWSMEVL